jgi:AcrR family transcriptional regulator
MNDRKERIVAGAADMFLEEGLRSVRMDDIAMRLGVSKRTLYEMFSDRSDLLEQSMTYYFGQMRAKMKERTLGAANVMEEIFVMMGSVRRDDNHRTLVSNLRKFYPEVYRRLEDEAHRFSLAEFGRLLDRGMEQGLFMADMNKELALLTLTYAMSALFDDRNRRAAERGGVSMQAAFEYVVVNFFRGLSTHKGIELIDELVRRHRERQNKQE